MRSQKNRNLIRRLITFCKSNFANRQLKLTAIAFLLFCSSALLLFCLTSCDKPEMLINRWNLQTVTVNGTPIDSLQMQYHLLPNYTYYTFFIENVLNVDTKINGFYTSSADGYYKFTDKSTLEMNFTLLNKRNIITAKIKKLTKKELKLEYKDKNNGNTYFLILYAD